MIVSLRENKLMVGFVTILVVMMGFMFSGSVSASIPNDESDFEFDSSTGRITGYVGESTDVVIPSEIGGVAVTIIGRNAFTEAQLTSVNIPEGVREIEDSEIPGLGGAFGSLANPGKLKEVKLPSSLEYIGDGAFTNNEITIVEIPEGVTSIGDLAFMYNELTSVVIPDSVTSIGQSAFYGNNLTSVVIPDSVTSIGEYAFSGNPLETVIIEGEPTIVGNATFSRTDDVSGNTNVTLYGTPNSSVQTYADTNGHPFRDIAGLDFEFNSSTGEITKYVGESKDVVIPSEIGGVAVTSIGDFAFPSNNITSVVIGDSVTSIGSNAFGDNELTSVVIPDSVTSIGSNAFRENSNLETVIIKGEPTIQGNATFSRTSGTSGNTNVTLYGIPNSSVQTYADANGHPFNALSVEDTLEGQHNILANILSGGLHLFASPIVNYGEILLGTTKETHYTGFEDNLSIHDLRGNHEGWSLTVSATTMANSEHVMPTGSLTLGDLTSIDSQVGTPTTDINEYTVIDDGSDVLVANAEENTGMGVTSVNFGENALGLVVDPKTTRATDYESKLTWTLVASPHIN